MFKNYIFDFGNVLARFYPEELTAAVVSDPDCVKKISEVTFDRIYWDRLDAATITDDEVKAAIKERLGREEFGKAVKVYDNWIHNLTPVPNMSAVVSDLKAKGKKIYLLSNISLKFANEYQNTPWIRDLLSAFDGVVFSAQVNAVKPERKIFEVLFNKFSLKAEECFFVDDNEANVLSARSLGIESYLFDGDAKKLREFIGI